MKIAFESTSNTALIRMVALGAARGSYPRDREHWRQADSSTLLFDVESLTMRYSVLGVGDDIERFFGTLGAAFTCARAPAIWNRGARQTAPTRRGYLFSMDDPDDATKKIGLLIETLTDARSTTSVQATAFYKTSIPTNGQVWTASPAEVTTLRRVKNSAGVGSTNPDDIGASPWYHTVME